MEQVAIANTADPFDCSTNQLKLILRLYDTGAAACVTYVVHLLDQKGAAERRNVGGRWKGGGVWRIVALVV